MLSVHDEAIYAERALSAGALGYVSKQQLDDTVLAAIRGVLAGETYMSEALRRRLAERYVHGQTLDIDAEPDLAVCAEAANPGDGLGAIAESRPDLVIADLSLGPGNGLELLKASRTRHAGRARP